MPVEVGGGQWSVQQTGSRQPHRTRQHRAVDDPGRADGGGASQRHRQARRVGAEQAHDGTAHAKRGGLDGRAPPVGHSARAAGHLERAAAAAKILAEPWAAPRTGSTDGVEIDLASPNAVAQFIAQQATVNTPAARAFVQDYRAGRVTDADVLDWIIPAEPAEPTPDERIAAASKAGQGGIGFHLGLG